MNQLYILDPLLKHLSNDGWSSKSSSIGAELPQQENCFFKFCKGGHESLKINVSGASVTSMVTTKGRNFECSASKIKGRGWVTNVILYVNVYGQIFTSIERGVKIMKECSSGRVKSVLTCWLSTSNPPQTCQVKYGLVSSSSCNWLPNHWHSSSENLFRGEVGSVW